jgi:hypothetical protein
MEEEIRKLHGFKQLLRPEERLVFDDLLNQCRLYTTQAGCLASPVKEVLLLPSMIFGQYKRLVELEKRLNERNSVLTACLPYQGESKVFIDCMSR